MRLKASLLATLAAAAFFLTACGGGGGDGGGGGSSPSSEPPQSPPASESQQLPPTSQPQQLPPAACQPQTVVGAQLQVAQSGSLVATLVSSPMPAQVFVDLVWSTGLPVDLANNQINAVAVAQPGAAWSGTTVELRPTTLVNGQVSSLPAGTPIVLRETLTHPFPTPDETATTGNDLGTVVPRANPVASVTFEANNTAVVSFPSFGAGPDYVVRLTNAKGVGLDGGVGACGT